MEREVLVEAQSDAWSGETVVGTEGGRWRRLSPKRRLAVVASVSALVAAISVVGGVAVGIPTSVTAGGPPPALVVAATSPGTTGASTSTSATGATASTASSAASIAGEPPTTAAAPAAAAGSSSAVSGGAAAASTESIHDVDLRNFDYPALLCSLVPSHDGLITMRDGFAGVGGDYVATVEEPVYGDVTGDGVDDAIVHVYCSHASGDYSVPDEGFDRNLAIVSVTPEGPTVISMLDDAWVTHRVTNEQGPREVAYGYARDARAEGGQLVVDWFEAAAYGRYQTTVSYQFDGGSFAVVGDTGSVDTWFPTQPPTQPPTPTQHGTSINGSDPYRMTLPLSDGRTCGPQFADLGPLADANLNSGKIYDDGVTQHPSDDVVTADGRATDAQVFVSYAGSKELTGSDGANEVERVVTVGCRRAGATTFGLLVLRYSVEGNEAIGWVFGPGPADVPLFISMWDWNTRLAVDDGDLVVDWFDRTGNLAYTQRLRWDGAAFVEVDMGGYCHL